MPYSLTPSSLNGPVTTKKTVKKSPTPQPMEAYGGINAPTTLTQAQIDALAAAGIPIPPHIMEASLAALTNQKQPGTSVQGPTGTSSLQSSTAPNVGGSLLPPNFSSSPAITASTPTKPPPPLPPPPPLDRQGNIITGLNPAGPPPKTNIPIPEPSMGYGLNPFDTSALVPMPPTQKVEPVPLPMAGIDPKTGKPYNWQGTPKTNVPVPAAPPNTPNPADVQPPAPTAPTVVEMPDNILSVKNQAAARQQAGMGTLLYSGIPFFNIAELNAYKEAEAAAMSNGATQAPINPADAATTQAPPAAVAPALTLPTSSGTFLGAGVEPTQPIQTPAPAPVPAPALADPEAGMYTGSTPPAPTPQQQVVAPPTTTTQQLGPGIEPATPTGAVYGEPPLTKVPGLASYLPPVDKPVIEKLSQAAPDADVFTPTKQHLLPEWLETAASKAWEVASGPFTGVDYSDLEKRQLKNDYYDILQGTEKGNQLIEAIAGKDPAVIQKYLDALEQSAGPHWPQSEKRYWRELAKGLTNPSIPTSMEDKDDPGFIGKVWNAINNAIVGAAVDIPGDYSSISAFTGSLAGANVPQGLKDWYLGIGTDSYTGDESTIPDAIATPTPIDREDTPEWLRKGMVENWDTAVLTGMFSPEFMADIDTLNMETGAQRDIYGPNPAYDESQTGEYGEYGGELPTIVTGQETRIDESAFFNALASNPAEMEAFFAKAEAGEFSNEQITSIYQGLIGAGATAEQLDAMLGPVGKAKTKDIEIETVLPSTSATAASDVMPPLSFEAGTFEARMQEISTSKTSMADALESATGAIKINPQTGHYDVGAIENALTNMNSVLSAIQIPGRPDGVIMDNHGQWILDPSIRDEFGSGLPLEATPEMTEWIGQVNGFIIQRQYTVDYVQNTLTPILRDAQTNSISRAKAEADHARAMDEGSLSALEKATLEIKHAELEQVTLDNKMQGVQMMTNLLSSPYALAMAKQTGLLGIMEEVFGFTLTLPAALQSDFSWDNLPTPTQYAQMPMIEKQNLLTAWMIQTGRDAAQFTEMISKASPGQTRITTYGAAGVL